MSLLDIHKGWTASGVAAARTVHRLYDSPVIFEDDAAIHLLSPAERYLCQSRFIYKLLLERSITEFRPFIFHSFSCQRYAEEQLPRAIGQHKRQYVILGAGFDSFALRRQDLKSTLRIFEVDHPQSQEFKQKRIAKSAYSVPENLEFVPVDFELETVLDGLRRSRFDFSQPAFCSWMGTVMYLTEDAVLATLEAIASLPPGSELIFNYASPHDSLSDIDREMVKDLETTLRRGSAPMSATFVPAAIAKTVSELGFDIRAHLSSKDLDERYLAGWDGLKTIPFGHLLHLQVSG
jgi:methyltransferase (TIGR00027 family)